MMPLLLYTIVLFDDFSCSVRNVSSVPMIYNDKMYTYNNKYKLILAIFSCVMSLFSTVVYISVFLTCYYFVVSILYISIVCLQSCMVNKNNNLVILL